MTAPAPRASGAAYTPLPESAIGYLAAALLGALFHGAARRVALMLGPGASSKYRDAPTGHQLDAEALIDHLEGRRTYAAALVDSEGLARAGCRDYDGDGDGGDYGDARALDALAAAEAAGLTAAAILLGGRAHVWCLYRRPAPAADIRCQLAALLPAGDGEIYPSGNAIRLPGGLHRHKATRGTLVLQDGRRFDLDQPAALLAGLRALLALPRNAAPPPAPPEQRQRDTRTTAPVNPADWADLPDGAALMASARYRVLFTRRPQLVALAMGRRLILPTKHGLRDSGSEQVSVLISNLLTTGRSAEPGGPLIPGLGAPPLAEVRALALYWAETLRPGYPLPAYAADVDRLIRDYTPAGYAPEATRGIAAGAGLALPDLEPARHRGRPAGQRAAQAERLAALLGERLGEVVTRAALAAALGLHIRAISYLIGDLRAAARVELATAGRGLRVQGVQLNTPAEVCNRSEGGIADLPDATPQTAPAALMGETHPPPVASCSAPGLPDAAPDAAPSRLGPAIWRSKGGDYPKVITGYSELAGAWFALADDTAMGHPIDELVWPDSDADRSAIALAFLDIGRQIEAYAVACAVEDAAQRASLHAAIGLTPRPSPLPPLPGLAELVRDALDCYGTTGGRAALRRVVAHVRAVSNGHYAPAAIEFVYRAELKRRRRARADDQLVARAERMSPAKRRRRMENLARSIAADLKLASELLAQPYRLDPCTGQPSTEQRSERPPQFFEARAWVWARQHAIIAGVHEARLLADFDADREAAALLADLDRQAAKRPSTRRQAAPAAPGPAPSAAWRCKHAPLPPRHTAPMASCAD